MIAFDFEYYRPASAQEAVYKYFELDAKGKDPLYYGGGTEIITLGRVNKIFTGAVIDIKDIPECNTITFENNQIVIGSAATLTNICESDIFPLLTNVLRRAADHTSRNKITIGGNICGKIPFREGVLPFLLCDSEVDIAGENGIRTLPIKNVFNGVLNLNKGEFLLRIRTDVKYTSMPFEAVKVTKQERVDYPLITIAAIKNGDEIRAAFSGVCQFPFRSEGLEELLKSGNVPVNIKDYLPGQIASNLQASAEYRGFVLNNTLSEVLQRIGSDSCASNA